eukprot:628676-Hanusia_phi.AAC.1
MSRDLAMTIRSAVGNGLLSLKVGRFHGAMPSSVNMHQGLEMRDIPSDCHNLGENLKVESRRMNHED